MQISRRTSPCAARSQQRVMLLCWWRPGMRSHQPTLCLLYLPAMVLKPRRDVAAGDNFSDTTGIVQRGSL